MFQNSVAAVPRLLVNHDGHFALECLHWRRPGTPSTWREIDDKAGSASGRGYFVIDKELPWCVLGFSVRTSPDKGVAMCIFLSSTLLCHFWLQKNKMATAQMPDSRLRNVSPHTTTLWLHPLFCQVTVVTAVYHISDTTATMVTTVQSEDISKLPVHFILILFPPNLS